MKIDLISFETSVEAHLRKVSEFQLSREKVDKAPWLFISVVWSAFVDNKEIMVVSISQRCLSLQGQTEEIPKISKRKADDRSHQFPSENCMKFHHHGARMFVIFHPKDYFIARAAVIFGQFSVLFSLMSFNVGQNIKQSFHEPFTNENFQLPPA